MRKSVSFTIAIFIVISFLSWENHMGFLKKLFGKETKQKHSQSKTTEEMRVDPNLIQIYDEYGREMFIDKETWRKDVLPGSIKDNWDKPDELYDVIVGALNDGLYFDVVKAAERLSQIDTLPARSACILGIVFMKSGNLDEAEKVLNSYIDNYGEDGVIVTNLAKIHAERGQHEIAEKTLWHALELDPNQDNAVEWWAAIHRDRSGKEGYISSLERVAELSGSWRAQLWLARIALEQQEFEKARKYHNVVLSALKVLPSEIMMQISGDLGNAGRIIDIIELFAHRFDPAQHGLMAGNNLIKAYLELNDPASAKQILVKLYKLNRPDWQEHLRFWEDKIDQASGIFGPVESEAKISVDTLSLAWPIWAHKLSSLDSLLPEKKDNVPKIAFISASCEYEEMFKEVVKKKTNKEGTLSRSMPLFFTEQIQMTTSAKSMMLIPVIAGDGSFIVSNKPWPKESLVKMARSSNADYILNGHLLAHGPKWNYRVDLINADDSTIIESFSHAIDASNPARDVLALSDKIRNSLFYFCDVGIQKAPISYKLPRNENFNRYLDGISQSLALSVSTANESNESSLYGERSIFDFLLNLALDDTKSDVTRLMFVSALAKNKACGSDIFVDYRKKVEKLLHDYPLEGKAAIVVSETLSELYSERD